MARKPLQESLGNTPRENSRLGWVTKGSLAWGGRKKLWVSRENPHLSREEEEKGRPQWCPVSSRMFLKMKPRGCWADIKSGHAESDIQENMGREFLPPDKGRLSEALWSPSRLPHHNNPQWSSSMVWVFTRSKQRWNPL